MTSTTKQMRPNGKGGYISSQSSLCGLTPRKYCYTARQLAAQCIVIGPVCVCVWRAGGQCPNLYYSQRAQCLRLSERFFTLTMFLFLRLLLYLLIESYYVLVCLSTMFVAYYTAR